MKILAEDESGSDTTGVGELCVRSPSLFKEYWRLPEVFSEITSWITLEISMHSCSYISSFFFFFLN